MKKKLENQKDQEEDSNFYSPQDLFYIVRVLKQIMQFAHVMCSKNGIHYKLHHLCAFAVRILKKQLTSPFIAPMTFVQQKPSSPR